MAKNKVVKENRYSDGTLATVGDVVLEDGELYVMIAFKDGIAQLGRVVKRVPIETCQKRSPEQALCDLMDKASRRNQPEPTKAPAPEAVEDSPLFKGK